MTLPDPDQFQLFTGQAASDVDSIAQDGGGLLPARPPRLCVLGSGSGGNSTAVHYQNQVMLIDAGFGPRTTASRLEQRGLTLSMVKAICLTHLDVDHFRPHWIPTLIKWGIRVYLHWRHLDRFWTLEESDELHEAGLLKLFTGKVFSPLAGLSVTTVRLAHDRSGTCAFRLQTSAGSIGYATDLGHVPDELIHHFADVDLLAIESNYDPDLQLASDRPWRLKERIMGPAGHLSNHQCQDAIRQIVTRNPLGGPGAIVLLHRSSQCNCPNLLRSLYENDAHLAARLTLSEQHTPSQWLEAAGPGFVRQDV
jgi:phosphoribosyl 1,2-cyclic phosphodiesterase